MTFQLKLVGRKNPLTMEDDPVYTATPEQVFFDLVNKEIRIGLSLYQTEAAADSPDGTPTQNLVVQYPRQDEAGNTPFDDLYGILAPYTRELLEEIEDLVKQHPEISKLVAEASTPEQEE